MRRRALPRPPAGHPAAHPATAPPSPPRPHPQCLFSTETFAMGLNMPAKTVVFTALRKWDGEENRCGGGGGAGRGRRGCWARRWGSRRSQLPRQPTLLFHPSSFFLLSIERRRWTGSGAALQMSAAPAQLTFLLLLVSFKTLPL